MTNLKLFLFGYPRIEVDSVADSAELARRQKACAIVYYLVITKQTFTRTQLAGLFWANLPTKQALTYLRGRSGLLTLRKTLEPYLELTRTTVAFNDTLPYWCDALEFERLSQNPKASIDDLERAIALYQGDFLVGSELDGISAEFDDWVAALRQHYSQLMLDTLERVVAYHTTWQQHEEGIKHATRLLAHDPWREETHRQLMRLYAYHGQRSAALAQYDACCDTLEAELGVPPSDETTQLFLAIRDNKLAQPLPIPFLPPAQVTHFVGRHELLEQLDVAVEQRQGKNIVALVGMGGIGKTTTAIHLAHRLRRSYEDGVLWANTAESDSAEILTSWALMYDVDLKHLPSLEARQTAWRGITEDKRMLLVLDNVESEGEVRPILPNSPHCAVIITTRNHDVAHALNAHLIDLPTLEQTSAYGLLEKIIGDERVLAEAEAADSICEQLEYLPLALEIVAQRLASRPRYRLATFAEQLAETASRLDPLTMGDRAVRASFELSWQMLSEELKRIFAGLAVFEGRSFSAEAMAYILEMGELGMVDGLEDLLALSLVSSAENERYRQHALLADFADEKVQSEFRNIIQSNQNRAIDFYLNYTRTNYENRDELELEWNNIHHFLKAAHSQHNWQTVTDIVGLLSSAYVSLGQYTEARKSYALAYEAAMGLESAELVLSILLHWGRSCLEQNENKEAEQLLKKCLELSQDTDNRVIESDSMLELSRVAREDSDLDVARKWLDQCQKIKEDIGDFQGLGIVQYRQARLSALAGELDVARAQCLKALNLLEGIDSIFYVRVLCEAASILYGQGDIQGALESTTLALKAAKKSQNIDNLIDALYASCAIAVRMGDFLSARSYAEECKQLSKKIGSLQMVAHLNREIGRTFLDEGNLETALVHLRRSEKLHLQLQDDYGLVWVLQLIAMTLSERGCQRESRDMLHETLALATSLNHQEVPKIKQLLTSMEVSESNMSTPVVRDPQCPTPQP